MTEPRARLPITAATIDAVGLPPLPLPPHVAIVDRQGRPTTDFHQWQMRVHEWRLRLYVFLGGVV